MLTPSDLIERLASEDGAVRGAAADELYEVGAAAVSPMIEAVRGLGPSPQYSLLMDTLGRLGRAAFDLDWQVRDAASRALVSMGTAVIPLLQDIRAGGPGRARSAGLYSQAKVGGETGLSSRDRQRRLQ